MKLQSLNCPNCGSVLRREGDVQICESCGSTFTIDYDESDVEYERLSTEEERTRLRYQHEKEMLETEYRLREEAMIRQEQRNRSRARKTKAANSVKSFISGIIVLAFFAAVGIGMFIFIKKYTGLNRRNGRTSVSTVVTKSNKPDYKLDPKDITADAGFMENAKAAIMSDVHAGRDGNEITTWADNPVKRWNMEGEPEIYDCYFLSSEKDNRLLFFIKITYKSEEGDLKEVYDAKSLRKITLGDDGKIKCDYSVIGDRGSGADDWTWNASLDADQLYRSAVLGRSEFANSKIELGQEDITDESAETSEN